MLFVYVAFMGGLVQFCWVFLVDILSSTLSVTSTRSAEQFSKGM